MAETVKGVVKTSMSASYADGHEEWFPLDTRGVPFLSSVGAGSLALSRGLVPSISHINKFGRNSDIDSATFEAVWNGGGAYTGHDATAAETIEVFSADDNDQDGGSGARTLELYGLDGNFDEASEIVTLNGTAAVTTTGTYIRCDRATVRSAGAGGENAGAITVRQSTTTANVFCVLPVGYNQTMICAYTVPNNMTAYMASWFGTLSGSTNSDSQLQFKVRPESEVFQVKEEFSIAGAGSSYVQRDFPFFKGPYAAKTDMVVMANASNPNTGIAAGFDLVLIEG